MKIGNEHRQVFGIERCRPVQHRLYCREYLSVSKRTLETVEEGGAKEQGSELCVGTWREGVSGGDTVGAAATLRPSLTLNSGKASATGGVLRDEDLPLAAARSLPAPARPPRTRRRGAPAIVCWFLLTLAGRHAPAFGFPAKTRVSSLPDSSSTSVSSSTAKVPWCSEFSFLRT